MTNPDEVKDRSYDDLDSVISEAPRRDKLFLLSGTSMPEWAQTTKPGKIGSEGVGKCNSKVSSF